jgi:hypothetical protein
MSSRGTPAPEDFGWIAGRAIHINWYRRCRTARPTAANAMESSPGLWATRSLRLAAYSPGWVAPTRNQRHDDRLAGSFSCLRAPRRSHSERHPKPRCSITWFYGQPSPLPLSRNGRGETWHYILFGLRYILFMGSGWCRSPWHTTRARWSNGRIRSCARRWRSWRKRGIK